MGSNWLRNPDDVDDDDEKEEYDDENDEYSIDTSVRTVLSYRDWVNFYNEIDYVYNNLLYF